jgi:hypothetical protein
MTISDPAPGPAALPLYPRGSEYLNERCGVFAEGWTAELVEQAIARKAKAGVSPRG